MNVEVPSITCIIEEVEVSAIEELTPNTSNSPNHEASISTNLDSKHSVETLIEAKEVSEVVTNEIGKEELNKTDDNEKVSTTVAEDYYINYYFENFNRIVDSKNICQNHENYFRGCKWSPDGTCLLTNTKDNKLQLFELPDFIYTLKEWNKNKENIVSDQIKTTFSVQEGGCVYDFCWYPLMSSWNAATCCFISSSKQSPVHLWDAYTGELRASYRGFNHVDELAAAQSVTFSQSGDKIYCGYNNELKIFDTSVPGRKCQTINLKANGQKGIVSCIEENPSMKTFFAVGTYSKLIGLYNENGLLCLLSGQKGGLTQLKFSETNGYILFSAARCDDEILCWDLRNPGKTYFSILRKHRTMQRLYFDLTKNGKYLVTGDYDGMVKIYDTTITTASNILEPKWEYRCHKDCCNSISLNNVHSILATASGQRHHYDVDSDSEDTIFKINDKPKESIIKLWWVGL